VIRYLADSSALWRLLRDPGVRAGWSDVISDHAVGSCQPQRTLHDDGDFVVAAQHLPDLAERRVQTLPEIM